jgi:hypothetical protein
MGKKSRGETGKVTGIDFFFTKWEKKLDTEKRKTA